MLEKAEADDVKGRFREVISDPTNLLIDRVPLAGTVVEGLVVLHNGMRVPLSGPYSYYGIFNDLLIYNRGVHEPLEEFVFQQLVKKIQPESKMLELGAYWGHYSMWLKLKIPTALVILVEPETDNIEAGRRNLEHNNLDGEFILTFVGNGHFSVDDFLRQREITKMDILHSDIQGFEVEMLEGARSSLGQKMIDYISISTHSQELHVQCCDFLREFQYRIEASADFEYETTSFDGFIFAASPKALPIFKNFFPFRRCEIDALNSDDLISMLENMKFSSVEPKAGEPDGYPADNLLIASKLKLEMTLIAEREASRKLGLLNRRAEDTLAKALTTSRELREWAERSDAALATERETVRQHREWAERSDAALAVERATVRQHREWAERTEALLKLEREKL